MPRWLAACAGAAGAAALQLETAPAANATGEPRFDGRSCLDDVLLPSARSGTDGCPAKFYMFDVTDPEIADCYGKYLSDEEFNKWAQDGMESHHTGPIFVARNLPKHRCAVQDPEKADLFVLPPFLPQWNQNFDNKDKVCQPKVMHFAARSEAYKNSAATGHSNFVVLNWWKGREWGSEQPRLFSNATFVGKDCKSEICSDPFVGWPYFDNTAGSFDADDTLVGIKGREKLAVGVWGSRRGAATASASPWRPPCARPQIPSSGPRAAWATTAPASSTCTRAPGSASTRAAIPSRAGACPPACSFVHRRSIPVILVDGLNLPFEHVIDYSKFAVRLPGKTPGQEVLDKLRATPADQVAKLQRNTVCVRRAFLYDARTQGPGERRGARRAPRLPARRRGARGAEARGLAAALLRRGTAGPARRLAQDRFDGIMQLWRRSLLVAVAGQVR
ncbi:unnamed protein product [Prorocentrum cordatum]|uniref:Exostosin GT47 domain-containing protein n=1 Tax=Prorocentrum cordatum TaxID=2364126 RepID=A0ABN9QQU6_9DINO|nr:unnamed protein product [Polarella glacialis]